jgi:hypothetical protein
MPRNLKALTTEALLAAWNDYWRPISEGRLPTRRAELTRLRLCSQVGQPEHLEQLKELERVYKKGSYGPALSTSEKRLKVAQFLTEFRASLFDEMAKVSTSSPFVALRESVRRARSRDSGAPVRKGTKHRRQVSTVFLLKPIIKALVSLDDEFFSDLTIAVRLKKQRLHVAETRPIVNINRFLAEYSMLMLGRKPLLTFAELHNILHWIKPSDLRKRIRRFRRAYGEGTVPLKPGRPGARPKKK